MTPTPTSKQAGDGQDDASAHSATPTALGQQVANLELCKELYELSGWGKERASLGVPFSYMGSDSSWSVVHTLASLGGGYFERYPAYDAGYLLRKLPRGFVLYVGVKGYTAQAGGSINVETWRILEFNNFRSDTPEDTLCKLAIELIKQGVIK